jgi:membrane complex biogenesis BtpA family protein
MPLVEWSSRSCPIVGMLHALPLPGSPEYTGDFGAVHSALLRDAEALVAGGVDGLMLENFGDTPFYPERVPAITVAAMTSLASDLRRRFAIPLGINVLRNDGRSALAVAVACGASFIRVNVLCGARVADQGVLQGIAHDLLRDRANLRAKAIQIWADVDVKHSAALAERPLSDEVHDLIDRGNADAVIVSGAATGSPIDLNALRMIKDAARSTPVLIGSGVTAESVWGLAPLANGVIVGSSLKRDGNVKNPVEIDRVRQFVEAVNRRKSASHGKE